MTLLERLRGKESGPPVFAPRIARLAARLEQVSPECLAVDPGALARTLNAACRLLELEAVVLDGCDFLFTACRSIARDRLDWWSFVEAETVSLCPRWIDLLDAATRLRDDASVGARLVSSLPGPWTLAVELSAGAMPAREALELAGDICTTAACSIAETRASALMIAEGVVPEERAEEAGANLGSICAALRYYGVASVIYTPDATCASGLLANTGADVLVTSASEQLPWAPSDIGRGIALPASWFSATPPPDFATGRDALAISNLRLITTSGEVSETTSPGILRHWSEVLKGYPVS